MPFNAFNKKASAEKLTLHVRCSLAPQRIVLHIPRGRPQVRKVDQQEPVRNSLRSHLFLAFQNRRHRRSTQVHLDHEENARPKKSISIIFTRIYSTQVHRNNNRKKFKSTFNQH